MSLHLQKLGIFEGNPCILSSFCSAYYVPPLVMTKAPLPENESDRLNALLQCRILDTDPEPAFDDIAHLAAQVCNTQFAFVTLIDAERQWIKALVGLNVTETSRNIAFCAYTILQQEVLIIPDTLKDRRFRDNPLVTGEPHIRFYAGAPLVTSEGYGLGTLCVVDQVSRELTPQQIAGLEALARQVTRQLELRRNLSDLERTVFERQSAQKKSGQIFRKAALGLGVTAIAALALGPITGGSAMTWIPLNLSIAALFSDWIYRESNLSRSAKETLEQERNFTTAILDTVGALIVVLDEEGKIVRFNRSCERISGYFFEEVRNRHFWDLLLPLDERESAKIEFTQLQAGQFPVTSETYWLTKHGKKHPIAWSYTALVSSNGSAKYIIGTGIDITDRKQAEAAKSKLAAIVESSNDAIIGVTLDGQIQSWNAGAEKTYGYLIEEVQGKLISDLLTAQSWSSWRSLPNDNPPLNDNPLLTESLAARKSQHFTKDGRVIDVLVTVSPIQDAEGKLIGSSIIARDVTAQAAVERMKDEFIAVVSHELRTPLTALKGALGLLLTGKLGNWSEKGQRMLDIALTNTNRLIAQINNILDANPNNYQLVKQLCNVDDIIQRAIQSVQTSAEKAEISISMSTISAQMYADPDRLLQVLIHLLTNAIKFSLSQKNISIMVDFLEEPYDLSTSTALAGDRQILIQIKDEGIGIPADKLETIFEPFQQVDTSTSRPQGGAGLGLAICRNLVEQHQGQIWAESSLGKGSIFYIVLPSIPVPNHL